MSEGLDVFDRLMLTGASTAAFAGSYVMMRRARLMEDTPTSKIRSAAQGYVELSGRVRMPEGVSIRCPLSDTGCAWWRYQIEVYERRGGKSKRWHRVEGDRSVERFLLEDVTGRCTVAPEGATVLVNRMHRWYGKVPWPPAGSKPASGRASRGWFEKYRYTEELIVEGDPLYALGLFSTAYPVVVKTDDGVGRRLQQWQADPNMLRVLDANRDGRIDTREWVAARQAAASALARERATRPVVEADARAAEGDHLLQKTTLSGQPFLLSTRSQAETTASTRRLARGLFLGSVFGFLLLMLAGL